MTIQETGVVMDILSTAYPTFYRDKTADVKTLRLWTEMFAEDDVRLVCAAVKSLIATKTDSFPPVIGAVKEQIRKISRPEEMTELEAWDFVRKALANSAYNSREEFEKLPKVVKAVVHAPEQLKEWARMDEATVQSVVASNFQRSYRAKAKATAEFEALPSEVKAMSAAIASRFSFPGEEEKPPPHPPMAALDVLKAERASHEAIKRENPVKAERSTYKPMSEEDFEKRRADLIRQLKER